MTQIDAAAETASETVSGPKAWPRGAFMLLFIVLASLAQNLLSVIAVLQFLWLLFARSPNPFLTRFGAALGAWFQATARYQACASEERPFPFADWPQGEQRKG